MDAAYVAASEVAAGLAFGLARRYPQYAARVSGLFASRAVPAGAVLYGAAEALAARPVRPCVARDEKEANAKFVKRGARVCLVATRAIAPHAEILTFTPHDPPARPTREAKVAYEHLRRAAFYGAARDEEKRRSHEREAKRHARRALRAIARANDAAFGAASAARCAECSRDPQDSPASMSDIELIAARNERGEREYLCSKHFNARRKVTLSTLGKPPEEGKEDEENEETLTKEPPTAPVGWTEEYESWEQYKSKNPYTSRTVAPKGLVLRLPPQLREDRASAKERRERAQRETLESKYANALKKFDALGLAPHGMNSHPVRPSRIQSRLPAALVPGQRIEALSAQIAARVKPP